jgi:hypothetical protein
MPHRRCFALLAAVTTLNAWAGPAQAPTPHELYTARCVAALDVNANELAAQVKAGKAELKPLLLARLRAGGAFVGESFLQGERDESRARKLLHQAEEAQKALPKAELAARQQQCAREGEKILADADALSRSVVKRLAERRMKKLLEG